MHGKDFKEPPTETFQCLILETRKRLYLKSDIINLDITKLKVKLHVLSFCKSNECECDKLIVRKRLTVLTIPLFVYRVFPRVPCGRGFSSVNSVLADYQLSSRSLIALVINRFYKLL